MLGGVGVDHVQSLGDVVDQDDTGLGAAQRRADALDVLGRRDLPLQLGVDLVGQPRRVGHQHGSGHRVVLGLADQVGRDVRRIGAVVGQDRDLGRPGLGVDADDALEQPLGGDDVDVAGSGDQVDRAAGAGAVGQHRDGLGAARGVHLVDAEQRARGQDRRVRQAVVVGLWRAGQCDRAHPGDLRGHDVHHHAGDQRRHPAGDVEADPVDRDHPLGDPRAGAEVGDRVGLQLGLAGHPQPADRLLQSDADAGCEAAQRPVEGLAGHRDAGLLDAVEARGVLHHGLGAAQADVLADRSDDLDRGLDIELGAWNEGAVVRCGVPAQVGPPQPLDRAGGGHGVKSRVPGPTGSAGFPAAGHGGDHLC